jgi:hypothetical protein
MFASAELQKYLCPPRSHYNITPTFPTAIMPRPKSCIICSAVASQDVQLHYCAQCQSALYCSKACQREDWKKQHKQICKLLNVGHGGTQVRNDIHTSQSIDWKKQFESYEQDLY